MKKIIISLIFIFTVLFLFAQNIKRLDNSSINTGQLDTKINQLMKDASLPGMAVTIYNDGKAAYQKLFGYKNAETKTPLQANTNIYGASLSKVVLCGTCYEACGRKSN